MIKTGAGEGGFQSHTCYTVLAANSCYYMIYLFILNKFIHSFTRDWKLLPILLHFWQSPS